MDTMAANAIQPYLQPRESLKWAGRPASGIRFRAQDIIIIPLSIIWTGFAIFWEVSVFILDRSPIIFKLWGIPFILIGFYIVIGRFIYDAKRRAGTCYGLSDERAFIVSGFFRKNLKSIYLNKIDEIAYSEKSDGSGSIQFGKARGIYGVFGTVAEMPTAFEFIPDCRRVYTLIEQVRRDTRATS